MSINNYNAQIKILGIPDMFIEHGTVKELHHKCFYDSEAIVNTIREMMTEKINISSRSLIDHI